MRLTPRLSLLRRTVDRGTWRLHRLAAGILVAGLAASIPAPSADAAFSEEVQVTAAAFGDGDNNGRAVAIDGDYAIVGARETKMFGEGAGVAYILERDGAGVWNLVEKLIASDANTIPFGRFGRFGWSVDIQTSLAGTFAVVGSPTDGSGSSSPGSVYIFERTASGWSEVVKLTAPGPAAGQRFGSAVALSGGVLAVGAPNDISVASQAGAVYIYLRWSGNWLFDGQLLGSGLQTAHLFGSDVDMLGNRLIVSAPGPGLPCCPVTPTVYVFSSTLIQGTPPSYSWSEDVKFYPGAVSSVSLGWIPNRWFAAVGVGGSTGVLVYESLSAPATQFLPPTSLVDFGRSVSLAKSGSTLMLAVGAPLTNNGGRVYLYEYLGTNWWSALNSFVASDASPGDDFGSAVSLTGLNGNARVIAGAPGAEVRGVDAGAAYVFEESALVWTEAYQQLPWDNDALDRFAESVAIRGGRMLVGAPGDDGWGLDQGAVYAFEQTGGVWTRSERLPIPSQVGSTGAEFGTAVALTVSGDRAIIGAPLRDTVAGSDAGAAYVFERVGGVWTEIDELTAFDGVAGDRFGTAVDIDGDDLIVGSPGRNAAYVYSLRPSGVWALTNKLVAASGALRSAEFGASVSIRGDRAVVGDPLENMSFPLYRAGGAYVFARTGPGAMWTQEARLGPPVAGIARLEFGAAVATDGDFLVVGSPGGSGAYVWRRNGTAWSQIANLTRPVALAGARFGQSVDLDGLLVAVGEAGTVDPGTTWIFYQVGSSYLLFDSLIASGGVTGDGHGAAVSIDGLSVAVGAPQATVGETDAGAATLYLPEPTVAGALAAGGLALLAGAYGRGRRDRSRRSFDSTRSR